MKDNAQAFPLRPFDQSPRSLSTHCMSRSTLGSDKAREGSSVGKRKPNKPIDSNLSREERVEEPIPIVNLKHMILPGEEKGFGQCLKPNFKAQEPMSKKGKSRKISPIWKQVVVNPFSPTFEKGIKLSSLDNSTFNVAKVREFRAGSSMSPTAKLADHNSVKEKQNMSSKEIRSM